MEEVSVTWTGEDLRFVGHRGAHETPIDSGGGTGPNPVALMLEAAAACMAIDVVDILRKGRQGLEALSVRTLARRRDEPPRYVTWIRFEFELSGDVDSAKAERAVALSLE
jgi:putative redox protein